MLGEEPTRIFGRDFIICWEKSRDSKTVLTARGFGSRWRWKRSLVSHQKRILKAMELLILSTSVKNGSKNTPLSRPSKAGASVTLWIGTIPTLPRLMRITTLSGIFSKFVGRAVGSIKDMNQFPGVGGVNPLSPSMKCLPKTIRNWYTNLFI